MKTSETDLKTIIKMAGLSLTSARKAILKLLVEEHGPFSAEEIYLQLDTRFDQATVFRTIKQFHNKGIINSVTLNEGFARYEYNNPHHHHHHIICRQCQTLDTIDECFVEGLEKKLKEKGYQNINHSLEFFGICPDCAQD